MAMTWTEQNEALDKACASFPETFGLRAYPGETFRVSRRASYWSDAGAPMIYTQRRHADGVWRDFAKGSPAELRGQIVKSPAECGLASSALD